MTYKCKICGGQTTIDSVNGIAVCDYCGTKQALPLFTDDSERMLYERGNNYLLHSEYDKAENVFNQLLTIKPNESELYWDLVLCKYGVTYVKDPKTGKYIPTCNRTHYTPIFSDENYQKSIELSSGEKKALFEDDAKTIDNIQKGIIAVSKKEKPFDIFISYKETDTNGNRTKDSVAAQKLYEKLTEAGYKVFFSRITLEDKVGTEYEPYIYAALYSSKVMLTICSSKENIEAVWVKNEWSRFLGFRQNDNSKTLLPLYFDMEKEELPEEFTLLSSYDMSVDGFEDELLRGIKKLIPLPIMKAKRRKQTAKILGISAACICTVAIVLTGIFLPGYLQEQKNQEAYINAQTLFGNAQYEEAAKEFELLGNFKDSKEMLEKCALQPDYDVAMQLYYDGKYAESAWAFEKMGDYEDSVEKKEQAKLSWRKDLATIATRDLNVYSTAFYYIDTNSTVKGVDGSAHSNLTLKEHGKIISISPSSDKLYALHEDGYVSNLSGNSDNWQDIIKISRTVCRTCVGLRSDGTMAYSKPDDSDWEGSWIEDIDKWKDIIDFEVYSADTIPYYTGEGAIIGIKSDGSLCVVASPRYFEGTSTVSDLTDLNSIIKKFNNVTKVSFEHCTTSNPSDVPFAIVALTKNGKMQKYKDGVFTEDNAENICDIMASVVLTTDGNLIDANGKIIARDVIQIHSIVGNGPLGVAITRTGTIYRCYFSWDNSDNDYITKSDYKSVVYDEWIARLN
ncbi:MAG: toll/interleukin-1 receptor domain-containing protein [Clostridia bacterium]|nr:toll/interleukin-1 receptor domain-containing protein [Clostridia bacterium]